MLRFIVGMGLGLWWTTAGGAQNAESPRLSLSQALQLALQNNPRITAAQQRVAAAQGRLSSARSHPHPELQLIPAGKIDDAQLVLFQPTEFLSGKQTFRSRAASAEAQAAEADLRAALNALLARPPDTLAMPADDLTYTPRDVDAARLHRLASSQRPEIQAAQFSAQSRTFTVKFAQAQRRPDLIFEWRSVSLRRNEGSPIGVGLTFPLFDFGRIRGEVQAAKAEAAEWSALLTQTQQAVALEVETALRQWRAARERVEAYASHILPDAEELMKMMQAGYPEGVTILEIIDAQRTLTAARLGYAQALADYRRALAELERAVGGKLPMSDATARR